MNEAQAIFAGMHDDLFAALAQDEIIQRGSDTPVPVRVVIDYGVEKLGDFGQVIGRVTTAVFLASEFRPRLGDVLTVGTGSKKVDAIDSDDGFVVKAVLHG